MENSIGVGFMAVFAVSGSVVLLAHQFNKRLLSHFMKDIEFELGGLLHYDHHHHHHHHHKKLPGLSYNFHFNFLGFHCLLFCIRIIQLIKLGLIGESKTNYI